jgi:NAD(P)-dependent dehydrogenase (short-subunit alcohol dehydrogenase family)
LLNLIIGANSSLTENFIKVLDGDFLLVGRSEPSSLARSMSNVSFVKTDYSAPINYNFSSKKIRVIFLGIGVQPSLLARLTDLEIDDAVKKEIAFKIKMARNLIPVMLTENYGRFIFAGSKEATRGQQGASLYSVIKFADQGLSRSIAVEYGKFGITSNVINIGLLEDGYSKKLKESEIKLMKGRIPANSHLNPDSIANLAKTVLDNPDINGSVLDVDQAIR